MKILFLPRYTDLSPSSRYRTYQYLKYFKNHNFDIKPLYDEKYTPAARDATNNLIFYVIRRYCNRLMVLKNYKKYDVIFLEKEFFPYIPFFGLIFKIIDIKYIVDYDDAVFHRYDKHKNSIVRFLLKNKISKVIKHSNFVITGSPYLTMFASNYKKEICEIPTSINFDKYSGMVKTDFDKSPFVIGWIGSRTTSVNVLHLIPVFKQLKKLNFKYELRLIGFDKNLRSLFEDLSVIFIDWDSESEITEIVKFSVGIMPLDYNHFNKGKCAFKLIQYMACGLPTISTPFESNLKVDDGNGNLFADSHQEWVDSFLQLEKMKDFQIKEIGNKNIDRVKNCYSIQSNSAQLLNIIEKTNN